MIGLGGKRVEGWETKKKLKLKYGDIVAKMKFTISEDARGVSLVEADWCRKNEILIDRKENEIIFGKHRTAEIKCVEEREPHTEGMEDILMEKTEYKKKRKESVCRINLI
jgi:Zn-finger nucleic acid-binding protein